MKIGFMQRDLKVFRASCRHSGAIAKALSERVSASFAFAAKRDDAWSKKICERQ
jgi:hypothetical protein